MGIPDLAVAYYQQSVQSLRQNLIALQQGTQLSIAELLEMWCTTYVLSEVEGLIGQFDAITLHIRGALQLYKLLAKRLRQSARNKDLNPELSRNYEYLIGNMAVCSIKSMQLPEQVAEIPTCFDLPNQPVGTLLGHGGECFIMMNAFRRKFPFRLRPDNPSFDAYALELNAVLNRLQAHRDEILAIPGSECVQSVTNSPFSPTIVFVDENLTMPFCATHLFLLMMAPHLEEDLLHHTTRNAMGILLGMSHNKQISRGKHFSLIGAYLQDPVQRLAFLQHCDMMSLELGIPAFTKVKELVERCWVLLKERYKDRVQDLSCQLIPLMTSVTGSSEGQQGLSLRPVSGSPSA
ncbi:hypothetical protein BCR37DRAFT_382200 [Protomyces lactucae-debilis]|uniref:Uncharacterized protein n=1 Tax=Protomyces lactucae-debilis TaxID=2754530 RepID=A0A1Y2F4F1_PROLT|nr:uncharacterized protein BCR37DRAFT_382200 [Protomyces lactucae-debilis]ORY78557.1 hypothetical protein BCR37DRAFT_382200 [Protomyces lactucae-debilis]